MDMMTAATERQTFTELWRIFRDAADDAQYNYVPQRAVVRLDMAALSQIVGAKFARMVARRCGFAPDEGRVWFRGYRQGEGAGVVDLDSIDSDLREAIADLDPLGLLHPFMKGRAEWV